MASGKIDKNDLFNVIFTFIIILLPILMYITGLSTAKTTDVTWYNTKESSTQMPDLMFSKFGLLVGVVGNGLLGISLLFMSKFLIRDFSSKEQGRSNYIPDRISQGAATHGKDKTFIEKLMFWCMPIMMLLSGLAYPLMLNFHSTVTGGILCIIPGIFFAIFGFWWWTKYSSIIIMVLLEVYAIIMIYTSINLFVSNSSEESFLTTLTSNTVRFFKGKNENVSV